MKIKFLKILIFIIVGTIINITFCQHIQAQSYYKFIDKNAEWAVRFRNRAGDVIQYPYLFSMYRFGNDTIVEQKQYSILSIGFGTKYLIREDNSGKVYFRDNSNIYPNYKDTTEYLLYDFSLNVRDTIEITYSLREIYDSFCKLEVVEIGSVEVGGVFRKKMTLHKIPFTNTGLDDVHYWVEGIGSLFGPIYPLTIPDGERDFEFDCYKTDDISYGVCYCDGDTNIQHQLQEDEILFYPNPVINTSQFVFPENGVAYTIEIYNSIGDKMFHYQANNTMVINKSSFDVGVYFYKVSNEKVGLIKRGKIIIQ